jgi:uncharacterized membrane protein YoaK (UPF0700 family)
MSTSEALLAASLIVFFVIGVIAGTVAQRSIERGGLIVVTAVLGLAALAHTAAFDWVAIALVVAAMGAENTIFLRNGEVSIGLTYMTGTLVRLGQRVVEAFTGGPKTLWLPYAVLWIGFVAGAAIGAATYPAIGMNGLWLATAAFAALLIISPRFATDNKS